MGKIFPLFRNSCLIVLLTLYGPVLASDMVGSVHVPKGAASQGDYMVVVFSNKLEFRPTHLAFIPGCHSVAHLSLKSGQNRLKKKGTLTFNCHNIPADARVFGWVQNEWRPMNTDLKTDKGVVKADFRDLTTYAIFVPRSDVAAIDPGQI